MDDDLPTVQQVNLLRLSRSHVVKLMQRYFDHVLSEKIIGCYVRVLLEEHGESRHLTYRMARIAATRKGSEYTGFSFNNESSTLYLDLDVPQARPGQGTVGEGAADASLTTIQLNSISNSDVTEEEYSAYVTSLIVSERRVMLPPPSVLAERFQTLLPSLTEAGIDVSGLNAAIFNGRKHVVRKVRKVNADGIPSTAVATSPGALERETERAADLERKVSSLKPFPRDLTKLGMDELMQLEKDVASYASDIRTRVADMMLCRICYERDTSVVLLPCRHQILCEPCSHQVDECPVCKTEIQERITPHKY